MTRNEAPEAELVRKAAELIRQGGVVAFPTETSYGLGASIRNPRALERIYEIKKRPRGKPLLVLVPGISSLELLAAHVPEVVRILAARFWPGPLTLIMRARPGLPRALCAHTGKVGVRVSSHPVAMALVEEVGHPITATSANISGGPAASTAQEVASMLRDPPPDLILDGGRVPGSPPSTILDVSVDPPRLLRIGAIASEDIPILHEKGPG